MTSDAEKKKALIASMTPVRDKLLIEDIRQTVKTEHTTESGIVISNDMIKAANSNAGKVRKCLVLAVGEGRVLAGQMVPICAKAGDIVTVPNYAWSPFTVVEDGFTNEYSYVRDEDVLGVESK